MRIQVGDLIFDSDKSEKLCQAGDFISEKALYKTPNGRYFFVTTSYVQAMSAKIDAADKDASDESPDAPLKPDETYGKCSVKQAKEFYTEHGDLSKYETIFGKPAQEA